MLEKKKKMLTMVTWPISFISFEASFFCFLNAIVRVVVVEDFRINVLNEGAIGFDFMKQL